MNIKIKYRKAKRCPNTFRELPLTGALPSRDLEIRGVIMGIAKINTVFKLPLNKLSSSKNKYQGTNQTAKGSKKGSKS